jgi:hypothetical protein
MHDEVGIGIGASEWFPEVPRGENGVGEGIHQEKPLGIDRIRACLTKDAKLVERSRSVRSDLDADSDLAELVRLLEHVGGVALSRECERRGKAPKPTPNHQERDAAELMHYLPPFMSLQSSRAGIIAPIYQKKGLITAQCDDSNSSTCSISLQGDTSCASPGIPRRRWSAGAGWTLKPGAEAGWLAPN